MKKIIIVSMFGTAENGGIERVSYYLEKLLEQQFSIEVLQIKKSLGKLNLIIYPIWFSILLLLKKHDIVISQAWHAFLYPSDIVICHGTTHENLNQVPEDNTLGAKYIAFLERIAFNLARTVWAVSNNSKEEMKRWYKVEPSKIKVVNNFVDEGAFYPISLQRTTTKCRILFSGRLNYRKGVDRVLSVANYIEGRDDVELVIACNDDTGIQKFDGFHNTVIYKGLSIDKMKGFYNSGDVLYFPTRFEGFSMAVLEALSCGIPVIGTKYALPEEFNNLDFTYRIGNNSPEDIVNNAISLKRKFQDNKKHIHNDIREKFGKEQYVKHIYREIYEIISSNTK